ncbi:MAG: protein translocase subunit SecF [Armatimonadota bacterium]
MVDLFRYRRWDLVSKRGVYYTVSGLMTLICIIALLAWKLNLGIDFKGGGLVTYQLADNTRLPADSYTRVTDDIRDALEADGINSEPLVSPGSGTHGDQIIVRTLLRESDKESGQQLEDEIKSNITPAVNEAVRKQLPEAPEVTRPDSYDIVSGIIKTELITKGLTALIIGTILIMGWIWFRYNLSGFGLRYSVAGLIALLHDLVFLVGIFALFRHVLQVNSPFIAALLTLLGYSIHDTIVIFDRIRENIRLRKGRTFAETVNISLLETMARSINTGMSVLFTLLALFIFGGPTLRDFVTAMLVGVTVGSFSSIFIASQLLVSWSKREEKVMLPADAPLPAMAGATPLPTKRQVPVASGAIAGTTAEPVQPQTEASRDAIQRAKQAGKTARRRR